MNFAEIRQKYPQYSDLSDIELAEGLHNKFYPDMSFNDFSQKIGLKDYMFSPEKAAERRSELINTIKDKAQGQALALDEGFLGGWGKKTLGRIGGAIGGGIAGVQNALESGNISDIASGVKEGWNNQDELKQIQKEYEEQNPIESTAVKIAGGIASPIFKLTKPIAGASKAVNAAVGGGKLGKAAQVATNILGQGAVGGLYGAALGSGTADDAEQYIKDGGLKDDAIEGAVLQAAVPVAGETIKLAKPVIGKGLKNIAGFITGTGADSVEQAYKAGQTGSETFLNNMRGKVSPEAVVGTARKELQNMVSANNDLYRSNMAKAFDDTTKLDVKKVSNKLKELVNQETLGGEIPLSGDEKKVLEEANKLLRPAFKSRVAQTTQGLDKIRRKIADIKTDFGTNAHRLKKAMENIIKDTISEQRPEYRKGLETFAKNKAEIQEIANTFGLGEGKRLDTALRKLQSVGRNNVQTNYGYRNELLNTLDYSGDIADALAGQNFNAILPRGVTARGIAGYAGLTLNPLAVLTSPRLIGETAYKSGRLSKRAKELREVIDKAGLATVNTAALTQPQKKKD